MREQAREKHAHFLTNKMHSIMNAPVSLPPGQWVYVQQHHLSAGSKNFCAGLAPKWSPPWQILWKTGPSTYDGRGGPDTEWQHNTRAGPTPPPDTPTSEARGGHPDDSTPPCPAIATALLASPDAIPADTPPDEGGEATLSHRDPITTPPDADEAQPIIGYPYDEAPEPESDKHDEPWWPLDLNLRTSTFRVVIEEPEAGMGEREVVARRNPRRKRRLVQRTCCTGEPSAAQGGEETVDPQAMTSGDSEDAREQDRHAGEVATRLRRDRRAPTHLSDYVTATNQATRETSSDREARAPDSSRPLEAEPQRTRDRRGRARQAPPHLRDYFLGAITSPASNIRAGLSAVHT
ncbi:uncharacterized protein LOC134535679 [Bacillus rossius redtenbacheri]|uniref:uncharacterized protein LOC134535679 n=1 Tax=Bacillus rossius redtenbacheri TaxID=93214 RepID=UPI002FDEB409